MCDRRVTSPDASRIGSINAVVGLNNVNTSEIRKTDHNRCKDWPLRSCRLLATFLTRFLVEFLLSSPRTSSNAFQLQSRRNLARSSLARELHHVLQRRGMDVRSRGTISWLVERSIPLESTASLLWHKQHSARAGTRFVIYIYIFFCSFSFFSFFSRFLIIQLYPPHSFQPLVFSSLSLWISHTRLNRLSRSLSSARRVSHTHTHTYARTHSLCFFLSHYLSTINIRILIRFN